MGRGRGSKNLTLLTIGGKASGQVPSLSMGTAKLICVFPVACVKGNIYM